MAVRTRQTGLPCQGKRRRGEEARL